MTEPLTPQEIEQKLLEENAKDLEAAVSEYMDNETSCCNNPKHGLYMMKEDKQDSLELIFEKQTELRDYINTSKPDNYYNGPERYPFESHAYDDCYV